MPKSSKRRTFTAQFKFRIALQAFKGTGSINGIAARENVHPTQVGTWKKEPEIQIPKEWQNPRPDSGRGGSAATSLCLE